MFHAAFVRNRMQLLSAAQRQRVCCIDNKAFRLVHLYLPVGGKFICNLFVLNLTLCSAVSTNVCNILLMQKLIHCSNNKS